MNKPLNLWWGLPLVGLIIGLAAGKVTINTLARSEAVVPVITKLVDPQQRVNNTQPFDVVNVALPPAPPIRYEPQLSAKIVDNKVVVATERNKSQARSVQPTDKIDENSELAKRFSQVLADMQEEKTASEPEAVLHAQPLSRYPQWYQNLVPPLEFSEHIYSSKKNERRVRVNNQVVKEGELIDDRMRIVKIEPQMVIIQLQQRQFSLPALSSW